MGRRALILEDDQGVGTLLAELCGSLGLEAVRARGAAEALERAREALPDLFISDLVLADGDGFQAATAFRALPGGERVPLLLVSGVYRQLPAGFDARVNARFLAKPFAPAALIGLVRGLLEGADAAAGLQRGRFDREPPAALFGGMLERRASGVLDVVTGEVRRRVFFQSGVVRFAQSNVRTENAGGLQLASGALSQEAFDRAVAHARQARVPLHDALAATGALPADGLAEALRLQTAEVALAVLGMAGAEWTFAAADVERQPDSRRHPLALLADHARRTLSPEDAREALRRSLAVRVVRSPALERELFTLRATWPGETVSTLATGKATVGELLERARTEDLPLLCVLVASGLLAGVTAAPAADGAGVAPERAGGATVSVRDEDAGHSFSEAEQTARRFILAERDRAAALSHYELLNVAEKASAAEIRRAYLDLARRYHSDAYAGLALGRAGDALSELFTRLNEAHETLSDEQRRAEYDIYLARRAKGLPTDVAVILRAESLFQRGEVLLRASRWPEAFELFREAVALNHAEPEFRVYLGYARYRVEGAPALEEARKLIKAALVEAPGLTSGHHFLGVLARETGADKDAIRAFEKALALDPNHEPSLRELRALRRRREGSGKGLLGKLFGR